MMFYDALCQWEKETEIVTKCHKVSQPVAKRCTLSQRSFAVPFPASLFCFRQIEVRVKKRIELGKEEAKGELH